MELIILGNSAGGPFHGRHYTAQVLQMGDQVFMIDCGEGAQMQIYRHRVKIDRCNHIFISHLHGDHVYGLMGLLTGWCLKKRTARLHVFSPAGLRELVETTARLCRVVFPYPIEFHEMDRISFTKVFENHKIEVWSIPLNHRIETAGWLFREKMKSRGMRPEKIETYQIPYTLIPEIKAGKDLILPDGRQVTNAELTFDPPTPLSYAFCSDTAPSDQVTEAIRGVNLLYHEATFADEHTEEAAFTYHSTAAQAAAIARKGGVGRLLIGHLSGRYADAERHLIEARAIFPNTCFAEEGSYWEVGKNTLPEPGA
jgi:ribonuclease Z